MTSKWLQRKFLMALAAAVVPVINLYIFDNRIPEELVKYMMGALAVWIGIEGYVDSKKV